MQRSLTIILDEQRLDDSGVNGRDNVDSRRTHELVHGSVSSEWLWALDPIQPDHVEADAYVAAVRLRLGASFSFSPLRCRVCNGRLDEQRASEMLSSMLCAASEKETLGLLDTAPGLRPAHVLYFCSVSRRVFLPTRCWDCMPSKATQCWSWLATESMRLRKRRCISHGTCGALEAEGIEYRPLVWSCWGREHSDTTAVLTMLARQAARRRGLPSHKPLLQKTRAQVGAALARRSAAMLRACTPEGVLVF